ncbi:hypothetical protein [Massilia glaciei]|uniref:Uncharacterized protein n=1 Tax=Massilia glaciei TaxID=1524097 RepID=A0A2U2I7C0_9BURK|nr:hypothetical protein [Massilia glaciei]PWF55644.1 hypothetical protein C7C56_000820 [Massilia glaciei]
MKTKPVLKVPKPRNPLAVLAKSRRAGAHEGDEPARRARRLEKHQLHVLLSGRKKEGRDDE